MIRGSISDFGKKRFIFSGDPNKFLDNFEKSLEDKIIEFLEDIGISATVKSDKFSLPYNNEVVTLLRTESYMNGMLEHNRVFRPIVKELLDKGVHKIRFYFWIDIKDNLDIFTGGLMYHFRYYVHY